MIIKPRGTKDIYGSDEMIYRKIFNIFENLATTYNMKKIITPAFESLELFRDANGETSDIVTKEIYKIIDYSNRELALKPEGTAPVGRAILENKLYAHKEYNKLYYIDSMFRYEKPQKGRLRQFYQIGVEFTNELSINAIIDSIMIGATFLSHLEIDDYLLHINSIGTNEERQKYVSDLTKYFKKHEDQLSEISKSRITSNPLRILDDKELTGTDVIKNAPQICDYWSEQSRDEFNQVIKILDQLKIKYVVNYSLVRGLDYYSNVVYEFISHSPALGSKVTIIGGGCYLDLIKNDENKIISGVGFGCGVERLFEILKAKQNKEMKNKIDVFFVIENDDQYQQIREYIYLLRANGVVVEYNYTKRKFKKVFDEATKLEPSLIVFQELNQHNTNQWIIKKEGKNNIVDIKDLYQVIIKNK